MIHLLVSWHANYINLSRLHCIVIFSDIFDYEKINDSSQCGDKLKSLYTYDGSECNGWAGISLAECERKCTNNEVPTTCTRNGVECEYVQYYLPTSYCHLGDATCNVTQGEGTVLKKHG